MLRRLICILLLLAIALPACGEVLLDEWDIVRKIKTREDRYLVNREGKWGVMDGENNTIVPAKYDDIGDINETGVIVCLDGKWGLIDYDGKILLEAKLRDEPIYNGEYAVAAITSASHTVDFSGVLEYLPIYGVIDRMGKVVVPFEYDAIDMTEDGQLLRFRINDRWGYMDLSGKYIIEPEYASIGLFEGDYAVATYTADSIALNSSMDYVFADGVIDRQGNVIIPFEYDGLILDKNGLIRAHNDENWGCINLKNEVVIELKYAAIYDFVMGYAPAAIRITLPEDQQDSLDYTTAWGLIDETGKEVLPFDYGHIEIDPDGNITTETRGKKEYFRIGENGIERVVKEEG